MIFATSSFFSFGQVTKSNNTGGSVLGSSASQTVLFNSSDFPRGCTALTDVNVKINWSGDGSVGFNFCEELAVRITSPSGTSVDLVQDFSGFFTGNSSQTVTYLGYLTWGAVETTFDDTATNSAQGRDNPENGSFRPPNLLSAFNGEDPSGAWTLSISDALDNSFGDSFTWTQFEITIDCGSSSTAPIVSTTPASSIETTSAVLGGNVLSDGGEAIIERGIVYSESTVDATPEIGETGVVKIADANNTTGVFSIPVTNLISNRLYSFRAYAINSVGVSYDVVETFVTPIYTTNTFTNLGGDQDWSNVNNWSLSRLPIAADYVTINHTVNLDVANVIIGQLTLRPSGKLNILPDASLTVLGTIFSNGLGIQLTSTLTSSSSLIVDGDVTGVSFTYERAISADNSSNSHGWHLIAAPFFGQTYNDSWVASNAIISGSGTNKGIGIYNTPSDNWSYFQTGSSAVFNAGQGYAVKRTNTGSGVLTFVGDLNTNGTAGVDVAVSNLGNGFNLLGNPYSAYINSSDFLVTNSGLLSSQTMWVFNSSTRSYEAKVTVDDFKVSPGQGFFVKCNTSGTFNFAENIQSHQTTNTFLRASESRPEIKINVTDGNDARFAKVYYLQDATESFDNGLDGEIFESAAVKGLSIFSRLVQDNGKKYQIQSLPANNYENMIIPIGLDAVSGSVLSFSADVLNFPEGTMVFLEDKAANLFVRIDEQGSTYEVTLDESLSGFERFAIHTSSKSLSVKSYDQIQRLNVFQSAKNTLKIEGLFEGKLKMEIYDVLGKQLFNKQLNSITSTVSISIPNYKPGVYLVKLETQNGKIDKKIILE